MEMFYGRAVRHAASIAATQFPASLRHPAAKLSGGCYQSRPVKFARGFRNGIRKDGSVLHAKTT